MILVSFSSAEDALFNNVKIDHTVWSQGTENLPFRFLGDTRYVYFHPFPLKILHKTKTEWLHFCFISFYKKKFWAVICYEYSSND